MIAGRAVAAGDNLPAGGSHLRRREIISAATLPALLLGPAAGQADVVAPAATGASLDAMLQPYLARYNLPALAAAVASGGSILASGAIGTRRAGVDIPIALHDPFSIGSDTKAMTALLAAIYVEHGKLNWQTTVGDLFPELSGTMDAGLKGVTLLDLLSHTSGIPSDNQAFIDLINESYAEDELNLDELRYWLVKKWAPMKLQSAPGTRFAYSNLGYTLLGAILERTGKATWEELIVQHVFSPFGFVTAGFGAPASLGRVDAPLGHVARPDGTLKPMLAGPDGDAPPILGPAGTVHISILEFAAWAGWNAGEGKRPPALVRPATLRKLHTPVIAVSVPGAAPGTPAEGGYGLGWGTVRLPYSSEPFVAHAGSNGMNLASVRLQPSHDFAMVMVTNVGGTKADAAIGALAEELYGHFGPAR